MVGTDADWWSCPEKGWSWTPAYYQSSFHNRGGRLRRIWEGGEGAKQPLVRLSWPVNQAGLDYHIWTTLLQPKACSSFASVDKNKKKRKGQACALCPCYN